MDTFDHSNLTRAQLVFWLGQKLNPDLPLYHTTVGLIIPKAIDRNAFNAAFQKLIDLCDTLRTVIELKEGAPQQRALDSLPFSPVFVDFSAEPDPRAAYEAWANERCHTPFDFEKCLFDSALVKLAEDKYVWYFCQHHMLTDMFSILIATQHLANLYDAALAGALDSVEPFPQFELYREQEMNQRGALGDPHQRAYWEAKLAEEPDPISFYGKPVPRLVGPIHRENVDLGESLSDQIRAMAQLDATSAKSPYAAWFNIFTAILFTYLYRINGVKRPSVGMPFHNRREPAHRQTVGLFMGVLPLSVDVNPGDSLRTLIAKIGEEASANLKNGSYYFHNLLHTQAHDMLVNGLFVPFPAFAGVQCEVHWPQFRNVLDPVVLNFYEHPVTNTFCNVFIFNGAVFTEEMQRLLIKDYDRIAHALLDNPDKPISDLELLTDAEIRRLLDDWNTTEEPYPSDRTIHQLVEEQVARTPDAVALAFGDRRITYSDMNHRANQLAHHLKSMGVGPDVLVGLCVERSPEMVIGLLGILKAGGAYVPLDPAYPADRLAYMLSDSNAHVVVTTSPLLPGLPVNGAQVVCIDRDWESIAARAADNPINGVAANDLAYVIYTSGSTGTPKGAMLEHRGVCNLVAHKSESLALGPESRVLQFASLSFDPSVCEIFMTLTSGGTLWLVPQETTKSPRDLVQLLKEHRITTALMTPSVLRLLPSDDLPDLRVVESGGEPCPPAVVAQWAKGRRFLNVYGPTETTVCATAAVCEAQTDDPPIGRPLPNTRLYVLDDQMRMVPPGTPGELYIGGVGVGRGYLNRPDLTAERFVTNPFANGQYSRLYRTGDRVRYREDGNIEFLGRVDDQVKIRGHRIELGEVESVIQQFPDVAECVAVAREDAAGDAKLVAYIVPRKQGHTFDGELKGFLRLLLPDYMLPSAFVVMDKLPLSPNGKIDRDALPAPEQSQRDQHELTAPRDSIELDLKTIWEQVLNVSPVGVTDHFFDIGGHSLSAVHLMDQIHKHFGVRLSPAALFEAPTIEAQAGLIRRTGDSAPAPIVVPLQPLGTKTPFFCVHPAPGTVFCYMPIVVHMDLERPFYGLQAPTVDGVGTVIDSIPVAAQLYLQAIRAVQPHGPYMLGGHSSGGNIALEMAQQLKAAGEEVAVVVLLDSMAAVPGARSEDLYRIIVEVTNDTIWLASIVLLVEHFFDTKLDVTYTSLRKMSMDQQFDTVLNALKRINFVAPSADTGAIRGMVENFRRTLQSTMQYQCKIYDGKIACLQTSDLFTSVPEGIVLESLGNYIKALARNWRIGLRVIPQIARDIAATIARSGALRNYLSEPTLGWQQFCTQPIQRFPVPGNHISMLTDPNAEHVAAALRKALDGAEPKR